MGWFKKKKQGKFLRMANLMGQVVVKFNGEGCQAMSVMDWMGKVVGFDGDKVKIQIIKYNNSYGDIRDRREKAKREKAEINIYDDDDYGIYTYPMMSGDLQCVDGCWILFT